MFGWLKEKAAQRSLFKIELTTRTLVLVSNRAYASIRLSAALHPSDILEIKKAQEALTKEIKLALAKGATFEEVRSSIELAESKEEEVTQGAEMALANVVNDIAVTLARENLDHDKNEGFQREAGPRVAIALKTRRERGHKVSTEADTCPHCDDHDLTRAVPVLVPTDSKATKAKNRTSAVGKFIVVMFILISFALMVGLLIRGPCESDWKKCVDNEQLVKSSTKWAEVQDACKATATGMARYGTPKWPLAPFSTFLVGNDYLTSGKAVAIEPDAQFQNAFGTMVHSRVTCVYDLQADLVIDVSISGVGISDR